MDAAASAVEKLLGRTGQKDTTVDQKVEAPVTNEHVTRTHEDRVQNVVEKEKHQDHYHTTVQPLKDREVKSESHDHKVAEQRTKTVNKDDGSVAKAAGARDHAFISTKNEGATIETKAQEQTAVGEHVHHHLHETIQPVIEKETVIPSVTHTTVPIKENIREQAVDHGVTKNAAMSLDEYKAAGNSLSGKKVHKEYAGEPTVNSSKD